MVLIKKLHIKWFTNTIFYFSMHIITETVSHEFDLYDHEFFEEKELFDDAKFTSSSQTSFN